MKKIFIAAALIGVVMPISGCGLSNNFGLYTVSAVPYRSFSDEDVRYSECRIELGEVVSVCGQGAWFSGDEIQISEGGVYTITGNCTNGCISISTNDPVKLVFNGAQVENPDGYAVYSDSERLVIESESGGNEITGSGGDFGSAVCSRGAVVFTGTGDMSITGSVLSGSGIRFSKNVTTFCQILRTENGEIIPDSLSLN